MAGREGWMWDVGPLRTMTVWLDCHPECGPQSCTGASKPRDFEGKVGASAWAGGTDNRAARGGTSRGAARLAPAEAQPAPRLSPCSVAVFCSCELRVHRCLSPAWVSSSDSGVSRNPSPNAVSADECQV